MQEEDEYRYVSFFVQVWAEAVLRQLERVREQRQRNTDDLWLYDREPLGIAPTKEDLRRNFRVAWAEEHILILAAHQLELWSARLAYEQGEQPPAQDPVLAKLRNTLEHLDEADFEGHEAVPGPLGRNSSLRALGGLYISLGPGIGGKLVSSEEIDKRALAVVKRIADEEYAKEEGYIQQYLIDQLRGK